MKKSDVIEIDSYDELLQMDPSYKNYNHLENKDGTELN